MRMRLVSPNIKNRGFKVETVDKNTSGKALIQWTCENPYIAAMVCVCWKLAGAPLDIWIGRFGRKFNPSELPPMSTMMPFRTLRRTQFNNLFALSCETKKFSLRIPRPQSISPFPPFIQSLWAASFGGFLLKMISIPRSFPALSSSRPVSFIFPSFEVWYANMRCVDPYSQTMRYPCFILAFPQGGAQMNTIPSW